MPRLSASTIGSSDWRNNGGGRSSTYIRVFGAIPWVRGLADPSGVAADRVRLVGGRTAGPSRHFSWNAPVKASIACSCASVDRISHASPPAVARSSAAAATRCVTRNTLARRGRGVPGAYWNDRPLLAREVAGVDDRRPAARRISAPPAPGEPVRRSLARPACASSAERARTIRIFRRSGSSRVGVDVRPHLSGVTVFAAGSSICAWMPASAAQPAPRRSGPAG